MGHWKFGVFTIRLLNTIQNKLYYLNVLKNAQKFSFEYEVRESIQKKKEVFGKMQRSTEIHDSKWKSEV